MVWGYANTTRYPNSRYRITISFGCDPARVDELTKTVFEQIDSLKNQGTTDKYITKVKETQRRKRETDLKKNRFWLNSLRQYYYNETDPMLLLKYDELVEGLTKELVRKTAKEYFDLSNVVKVVLIPDKASAKN